MRDASPDSDSELLAFGVLSESDRQAIRASVLLDLVAPCAKALARSGERYIEPSDAALTAA